LIEECNICNFADDNTIYACDTNIENVLKRLNNDLEKALNWFKCNFMVANPAKFQIIFLGIKDKKLGVNIDGKIVLGSEQVKLLGVILDNNLNFLPHIKEICAKANSKTKALLRIRKYLNTPEATILCNSFILSCFNYCPIVWMFSNKEGNSLISATHRRVLRALINNFSLSYERMLELTGQCNIHEKNLRYLALEVFKSLHELNPIFMREFFTYKNSSLNLRRGKMLNLPSLIGINSWLYRSALLWNNLPKQMKEEASSLAKFKSSLARVKMYCKCKICS
jgi:hypothetical protein